MHQSSPDRSQEEGDRTKEDENLPNTIAFKSLPGWLKYECFVEARAEQEKPDDNERGPCTQGDSPE
ncbi:hypothetical protein [Cryobacterium sp. Hz9]|uniref:hypothetical protein n=1 Tax=Cryobacterium sp. Hz9 TaxID=1259167 RepID=UPI00106BD567|nr:hypothetical protein [Cryobacterium sp. Hz9]TFB70863.1 hypothetical protein E3N85_00655 [Cryobacterium sp. Hz9]